MKKNLQGIIAPISTPFIDGEVAYDQLTHNILRYAKTRLSGIFALGSNGENPALEEQERLKVFETIMKSRSPEQTVIAGTAFESTQLAIRFARILVGMGADYISVLTPSYYKKALSDDAQIGHFQRIADALPVPILIYNVPGHTGITLSPKVVESLAQHPNIAAMKDVAPGMFSHYLQYASDHFSIIAGTIDSLLPALMIGAVGGVVSLANAFPEACCELYKLFKNGELSQAKDLYRRLLRLNQSISGVYAVAGVKAAMDLNGYFGGDPRLPLLPLSLEQKQRLAEVVNKSGVLAFSEG
jgi:4-hydroxy-2-oxoglutarate aldolase